MNPQTAQQMNPFQNNEIIVLILAIALCVLWFMNRESFSKIPKSGHLSVAMILLGASWFFTVLEGFVLPELLNLIEHICLTAASAVIMAWIFMVFGTQSDSETESHNPYHITGSHHE
ncbi:MAG: hypothetical protein CVV64_12245 [Candidatus Wallbacteria bacterium HGW-Wallbacteria-1]|jgi:glucan phosphoethanolaminetransferase (alkaline phosphatase superfamily)|uniref:Uncharacterized protein n=1 Tax=Candidatus Wallbacteria bacterium HGW-Wallbacteria-1 TaxID=2013854 RepID=A0A2N1PNI7_9BACT|nr:MAG: hypothetical protein CVV64_12245 [Candidatus Wallbacteria bacterium HGW-Wallbacteria-1]